MLKLIISIFGRTPGTNANNKSGIKIQLYFYNERRTMFLFWYKTVTTCTWLRLFGFQTYEYKTKKINVFYSLNI